MIVNVVKVVHHFACKQRLFAAQYPAHPYRRAPSGTDAGLARISAKACEDDFRARFGPNRALVTVVGRFDPASALALARTWLEPLPRRVPPAPSPARPAAPRVRRASEPIDFRVRLVSIGWRAPGEGDPDAVSLDLLGLILSSGSTARLTTEKGGPNSDLLFARAAYEGRREGGLFHAYGALRRGVDSAAVEQDLAARIEKLAAAPVTQDELERAKRQAESAVQFGWQTVHARSIALGRAQLVDGDFHKAWSRLDRIRKLSAADLQRAAAKVLKRENRSVVWLVPAASPAPGGRR